MAQMTLEQGLVSAFNLQNAGRLGDAEKLYRQIIAQHPDCADALHLLGVIRAQRGEHAEGLELIRKAIALHPDIAGYHANLGNILVAVGQSEDAVAAYRHALQLNARHADTYMNMGIALEGLGRLDEAAEAFGQALSIHPNSARAHHHLGSVLQRQENLDAAISEYRAAIALQPSFIRSQNSLGNALFEQRRLDEAIRCYREALAVKPDFAEAWSNLGNVQFEQKEYAQAIDSAEKALAIRPDFAEAMGVLGNALRESGRVDEAIEQYRKALTIRPDIAEIHVNLGLALAKRAQFGEAMAAIDRAIEMRPDWALAWSNRAKLLRDQGWLEESIKASRRALEISPYLAEAHINLGGALLDSGNPQAALASAMRAIEIAPNSAPAHNLAANARKDFGEIALAVADLERAIELEPGNAIFHSNKIFLLNFDPTIDAPALFDEQRKWNQRHAAPLAKEIVPHENDRDPQRRLRIGYVSPDFRDHCQSFFTLPLLSNQDHTNFELFAYADLRREDAVTGQIRQCFDQWRSIRGMSDVAAAEIIRRDRIDILVDLTMHMADGHLLVFARKPAPLQVTWLAYPGSTGMPAIDYRLTDPYLDPPSLDDRYYVEKSIRLPDTFWCYHPPEIGPVPGALPALSNGFVTFGCLNNFCKVNDAVLKLWARVLSAVERSRLILLCPEGEHRTSIFDLLSREGISRDRVELVTNRPRPRYLELYQRIDLGLDTFPYNGHTTSLDSLWMGVPMVTLAGQRVVGRAGVSQLTNLDLKELVAFTPEEYVKIAKNLAGDLPRLKELRGSLRGRMENSPLTDGRRFARGVETAYRQMWKDFCASSEKEREAHA